MRHSKICYFLLCIAAFCSCSKNGKNEKHLTNRLDFSEIDTVAVQCVDSSVCADSWIMLDGEIVCKTESPEALYTVLDSSAFSKKYVFGKKGHGKNEWVAPHILAKTEQGLLVLDNGDKKLYSVKDAEIQSVKKCSLRDAVNDAKEIEYPVIGYVSTTPDAQYLKLTNVENDNAIDSISFVDTSNKGNASLYDFVWNSNHANRIVIAHQHSERYIVYETDSEHRIVESRTFDTKDDSFSPDRITYSDIACGNYIYLLSQKNVNVEDATGFSEIEIYDYDGVCIKKLVLNIIADKMLLDEANHRLLLTSIEDASINVVKI